MFRILKPKPALMGIFPSFFGFSNDEDIPVSLRMKYAKEGETGEQRIRKMFTFDEYGTPSPELSSVFQATSAGTIMGLFLGGFLRASYTAEKFIKENQATKFESSHEARKMLQNKVAIDFFRGAAAWAGKLGTFVFIYTTTATVISVYRGKSSVWEYIIGGAVTGGLFKLWLGLKGMITGASVGMFLGLIGGITSLLALKLSGSTMEEVRLWQHDWRETRHRGSKDSMNEYNKKEEEDMREIIRSFQVNPETIQSESKS